MTKYQSPTLEVTLDLPDGWLGVENKEFFTGQLGIAPEQAESTALLLVKIEGEVVTKYISVTHDMEIYADVPAYEEALAGNKQTLTEAGCQILSSRTLATAAGNRVDHVMVQAGEILMSQYYVHINELLLCFATQVAKAGDPDDNVMANIVYTMSLTPTA
ncbi:MAG: hypothetical protein FWE38_04805 [Firmicutes bacterium]|nr:hypothetical protein [Bacillota bacterium]